MGMFGDLFNLWNEISILLLIFYIGTSIFGFLLIYKQVSIVKKGEFSILDRFVCVIYGLIFGLATITIIAMIVIFIIETPELWQSGVSPPEIPPYVLILPMIASLFYISGYPLFDFIFIAWTEKKSEGLTPFHEFIGKKIINRFPKPYSLLVAVLLYFTIFLFPPIMIWLITNGPVVIIWMSWMLIYPLMILTFYGAKGYVAGISNVYYHLPELNRYFFLGFENGKRSMEEFGRDPAPRIILGVMLFVFVWTWISLIQTVNYYFSGSMAISTMSYAWMVIIVLIFGIIGYFTRFWGRKIKYRGIDVYFAGYLIAAVGLNVLVNFLIVNANKLENIFNSWIFTQPINTRFIEFVPAAIIEEVILLSFILFYIINLKNEFTQNLRYSMITKSGQTFDPIPLFNFIKNSDKRIRDHAEETIKLMFERIPRKGDIDLTSNKYKNALFDGICDPNSNSKRISTEILVQLENDAPDTILSWIIEGLKSPNYDKKIPILETLIKANEKLISQIPINVLLPLIKDAEWHIKYYAIMVLSRIPSKSLNYIALTEFEHLLQDSDYKVQEETLKFLIKSPKKFPLSLVIEKLKHPNKNVRAAAAFSLQGISIEDLDSSTVNELISLMNDPNKEVRTEIFTTIAKIGNFKEYFIPIKPFLDGLLDPNEAVRNSAIKALEKYHNEVPTALNLDYLLSKMSSSKLEIQYSILRLLGKIWETNPEKITDILLKYIKSDDEQIKNSISNMIINIGKQNPEMVFSKLITIPDSAKFITKGIITKTVINIVKENPKLFIPKLLVNLNSDQEHIKLTSINSLSELAEDYIDLINIDPFINILKTEGNKQFKTKASKIISIIAIKMPNYVEPLMSVLLNTIIAQEKSVKITLSKSLVDIAKNSPKIIPIDPIINLLKDKEPFVRESAANVLFYIGHKVPDKAANALIDSISDDEWVVRDAVIKSLGNLIKDIKNYDIILNQLIKMLDDDQKWVRRSSMEILTEIPNISPKLIPFNKISKNLRDDDERVRESSIKLIEIYSLEDLDEIFPYIVDLLNDPSDSVREKTVISVSQLINKIGIKNLLSTLLKLLSSDTPINAQRSVAKIFLRTAKYEKEDIKKRIIALLKIRCEMSQDSIICNVLQELQ